MVMVPMPHWWKPLHWRYYKSYRMIVGLRLFVSLGKINTYPQRCLQRGQNGNLEIATLTNLLQLTLTGLPLPNPAPGIITSSPNVLQRAVGNQSEYSPVWLNDTTGSFQIPSKYPVWTVWSCFALHFFVCLFAGGGGTGAAGKFLIEINPPSTEGAVRGLWSQAKDKLYPWWTPRVSLPASSHYDSNNNACCLTELILVLCLPVFSIV